MGEYSGSPAASSDGAYLFLGQLVAAVHPFRQCYSRNVRFCADGTEPLTRSVPASPPPPIIEKAGLVRSACSDRAGRAPLLEFRAIFDINQSLRVKVSILLTK